MLKSLGLLIFVCVAGVIAATSLAGTQENGKDKFPYKTLVVKVKQEREHSKSAKLSPLVLPDIQALSKQLWKADRSTLGKQYTSSMNVIRFWNNKGSWIRAPRQEKCWDVPWQRSCTVARASLRLHTALASIAETRLTREMPVTNDWRTAVRLAQRPFPGTESWLLYISHREGGYGGFVMNHQGSGAGGWMQFMASTFWAYADNPSARDDAKRWMKRHGYIVDDSVWQWTNPMGQALTAGWMRYTHRDGCHWCL